MLAPFLATAAFVLAQAGDTDDTSSETALVAFLVVMVIVIAILAVLQSRRRVPPDEGLAPGHDHDDEARRLAFEERMRRVEDRLRSRSEPGPPAGGSGPAGAPPDQGEGSPPADAPGEPPAGPSVQAP
jgi:hypothetical protein